MYIAMSKNFEDRELMRRLLEDNWEEEKDPITGYIRVACNATDGCFFSKTQINKLRREYGLEEK